MTGNSGDGGWTKTGIMARAGTSTLVADIFIGETSGNNVLSEWTSRSNTAPNNYTTGGTLSPQWIKMTYDGNGNFKTYYSDSTSAPPPAT